jgi:hypothetical protein
LESLPSGPAGGHGNYLNQRLSPVRLSTSIILEKACRSLSE